MQTEAAIGIAVGAIFSFLRWAVPIMPKPIAWCGVIAGVLILAVSLVAPQMNLTIPAIALFLTGAICIGGAIHLSLKPKASIPTANQAAGGNSTGDIRGNTGIITQGQQGDNSIRR